MPPFPEVQELVGIIYLLIFVIAYCIIALGVLWWEERKERQNYGHKCCGGKCGCE